MANYYNRINSAKLNSLSKTWISGIVGISFLMHFITYTFSSSAFMLVYVALIGLFVVCKPIQFSKDTLNMLWFVSAICIICSYTKSLRLSGSTLDILVILFGILLILFPSKAVMDYNPIVKVVFVASSVYMASVFLQAIIPSVYNMFVSLFPTNFETAVRNGVNSTAMSYNGFTTNVGFAAGFISSGILAIIATNGFTQKWEKKRIFAIVFMTFAVMLTGKRGTTIFVFLAIVLCYLITAKGSLKIKRYFNLILLSIFVLVLFFLFYDNLSNIPFVRRIIESIAGLFGGEDVSSSRIKLWKWAIVLFKNNPLDGIGWGNYRTTVIGNVTYATSLDAHNIYLQLLCETGIIGAVCIIATFLAFWIATKNAYKQSINSNDKTLEAWSKVLLFSMLYQTFFLLYGLSGNPLYDQGYQILYMISCSIVMGYRHMYKYYIKKG